MNKFKIGDLVYPKENTPYIFTSREFNFIGITLGYTDDGDLLVRHFSKPNDPIFEVYDKHFDYYDEGVLRND